MTSRRPFSLGAVWWMILQVSLTGPLLGNIRRMRSGAIGSVTTTKAGMTAILCLKRRKVGVSRPVSALVASTTVCALITPAVVVTLNPEAA